MHSMIRRYKGFTLVEMLVAIAVLALMMLFLFSIVSIISRDWKVTTAYSDEFQGAQDAFNDMTRHLSQATLNTYSDYNYASSKTTPPNYIRQSELRFITGQASTLLNGVNAQPHPTHAMFFVSPLGVTSAYSGLPNLLNTCGYYVEYNNNAASVPAFLASLTGTLRSRDRLMELIEPSESMTIYNYTSGLTGTTQNCFSYNGYSWFTDAFKVTPSPTHILAENIIALIIMPRSPTYTLNASGAPFAPSALAPAYSYDTSPQTTVTTPVPSGDPNAAALNPSNQLPPLVQVTLVALDESSALRVPQQDVMSYLSLTTLFQSAASYTADMTTLESALDKQKLNYRVFTTTVAIKSANWSTAQTY